MDGTDQAAPGTAAYFSSLLSRVHEVHPDLPFDAVIFQSILLCLVAGPAHGNKIGYTGRKNLVLRAREEDIAIVLNLAYLVLTRVFGIVTTKHKVKKESGRSTIGSPASENLHANEFPDDLIRSCFLRGKSGPRFPSSVSKHHRDRSRKSGSLHGPRRSATLPSASPTIVEPSLHSAPSKDSDSQRNAPSLSSLRIRPKVPRMETEPASIRPRPLLEAHSLSEPQSSASTATPSPSIVIPGALVISGLEYTSLPSQRALLRVLHERRIVLDAEGEQPTNAWKLPSDFIMVYVGPLNAYDRPPILRTLLDHFGMSADANISPALRQAYLTYQNATSPLSSSFQSLATPRSPLSPLWSPDSIQPPPSPRLRGSPLHPGGHQHTASVPPVPIITPQELSHLRTLTAPAPPNLCQAGAVHNNEAYTSMHPTLNVYLQDLFAAARHHPMVDGSLLTLRAHHDAEDLVRAFRVVCGDSLGSDLVSTVAAASTANGHARHSMDTGSEDVLSSPTDEANSLGWDKTEDEWLGAELQMGRQKASSVRSLEIRVNGQLAPGAHSVLFDGQSEDERSHTDLLSSLPRQPEVWDISEADIGKVFPRVVSHRLRMRTGRDDEVLGGVMFPAVQDGHEPDRVRGSEDKTVKQVIIGILADV